MFCQACGGSIIDTAVVCIKCGSATKPVTLVHDRKFIKWGWATAFLLPIVGIGLGIYNAVKGEIGHGIGQIIVSVFMWSFWAGFFMAVGGY